MIEVWKETLLPGTMVDPKTRRTFTITDKEVLESRRNLNRMVRKGLNIPLVWEHQDVEENDDEEWKANYARNTFGRVGGAKIASQLDVDAGIATRLGTLLVRHDVHEEKDAKQLSRTGYVSPKLYKGGYLDSTGEEFMGCTIAHIASTPSAVQFWQKPFMELSADDALYLSYLPPEEEFIDDTQSTLCPHEDLTHPDKFEDWLDWVADKIDDHCDEDEEPTEVNLSTTETPEDSPVPDEAQPKKEESTEKPPAAGGGGKKGKATLEDVIKALKDTGMNIPDEVEDESGLVIAIKASGGGMSSEPEEPVETSPEPEPATEAAGGAPMMMSTTDKDPKKKSLAEKEAKPEREDAVKRIDALFAAGKIDGPTQRKLRRQANSYEMSFTDGEVTGHRWVALVAELDKANGNPPKITPKHGDNPLSLSTTTVPLPELAQASAGVNEAAAEMKAMSQKLSGQPVTK